MNPERSEATLREHLRSFADSVPVPDHLVASARGRHRGRVRRRVLAVSIVGVATIGIVAGVVATLADQDPDVAVRSPSGTELRGDDGSQPSSSVEQTSIDALPGPVPLTLVAARPSRAGFVTIDLADGTITSYPSTAHTLPRGIVGGLSMTATGDAVAWFGSEVFMIPEADFSNEPQQVPVEAIPYKPGFAPSMSVVPTPDGTRLWIVQRATNTPPQPASSTVQLIDLTDGAPLLTRTVGATLFPVSATPTSLVLNHPTGRAQPGGEPPGTFVLGIEGEVDYLSTDIAVAAKDDVVALLPSATSHLGGTSERIELLDLQTGARTVVDAPPDTTWSPVGGPPIPIQGQPLLPTVSDDGRLLAAARESSGNPDDPHAHAWTLYEIDMQNGTARPLTSGEGDEVLSATWSRDGRWVAIIRKQPPDGQQTITLLDTTDREAEPFQVLELPEERFVLGAD